MDMEGSHRGRSSSASHQLTNHLSHSPSPHPFQDRTSHLDIDSSISAAAYASGAFNAGSASDAAQTDLQYSYIAEPLKLHHYDPDALQGNQLNGQDLEQSFRPNGIATDLQHRPVSLDTRHSSHRFTPDLLSQDVSNGFGDFPQLGDLGGKQSQAFDNGFLIDQDLQGGMQPQLQSINPADIMSTMSSPQNLIPTPPSLMPPDSTSPRGGSPSPHQNPLYSPNHSRHASLDPSSAIFPHGQQPADWSGMLQQTQFQGHRRAPSEQSDVSSSVAPSPYLQQDGFETFDHNPSPMLHAQQDSQLYQDALGMEQFSLSDSQQQQQQQQSQHSRLSPRHSPYVSPRMSPQLGLGLPQENNFMLSHDLHSNFDGAAGTEIYAGQADTFSPFGARHGSGDLGQAAHMAPPEINVEFAPTTRQSSFEPSRSDNDHDALSPPERGRRGRIRAKSDPYISRPVTPSLTPPHQPSFDTALRNRSLSPFDTSLSPSQSRDPSPASKASRRSSTSSIPNRDYILELADPSRPAASGTDKRVQKHPATFQCHLCPKRFTRAYNLRSHLRTHTDERPFVCTVCGKAFARQHDRKRHEGLHSGEKKFVCKGELGMGGNWGCGRRFARADALGRHFRSEAGRVCIKPLLDEEAMERQRVLEEQMMGGQQPHQQGLHIGGNVAPSGVHGASSSMDLNGGGGGFTLPAALLAQYPALQGIQWDQLGQPGQGDEGEPSGRGGFDTQGGGGDYFDDDDGGGGVYGGGGGGGNRIVGGGEFAGGGGWGDHQAGEWASDYEGR